MLVVVIQALLAAPAETTHTSLPYLFAAADADSDGQLSRAEAESFAGLVLDSLEQPPELQAGDNPAAPADPADPEWTNWKCAMECGRWSPPPTPQCAPKCTEGLGVYIAPGSEEDHLPKRKVPAGTDGARPRGGDWDARGRAKNIA